MFGVCVKYDVKLLSKITFIMFMFIASRVRILIMHNYILLYSEDQYNLAEFFSYNYVITIKIFFLMNDNLCKNIC